MKNRSFTLKNLFALTLFFSSLSLCAQTREVTTDYLRINQINGSATATVLDHQFNYMNTTASWGNSFCMNDSEAEVALVFDERLDVPLPNSWTVTVPYTIKLYNENNTVISTQSGSLQLNNNTSQKTTQNEVVKKHTASGHVVKAVVSFSGAPSKSGFTTIPNNFYLEVRTVVDRQYKFSGAPTLYIKDYATLYTSGNEYGMSSSASHPRNRVVVSWTPKPGVDSYDLEWLFIDIGKYTPYTDNFSYDFSDATRISLTRSFYGIPLVFPRGWVLFRVRGVGKDCNGNRVYTGWSNYSGASSTGSAVSYSSLPAGKFIGFHGLDSTMNWQYRASFAEEGKASESLSFFDGSLRNRQTVTHLGSSGDILIQRSLYDYQGRKAVDILPYPVSFDGLGYYPNLDYSQATTTEIFDRRHFDRDGLSINDKKMATSVGNGASKYYSSSSSFASEYPYLPDAEGLPYTRTKFFNDGTNRVKSTSGAGVALTDGSNRETKYYYGSPNSQEELDRLFGSDVGYVNRYTKQMVRDPNGQSSVTYKNEKGQTIASALVGDAPNNLTFLDHVGPFAEVTSDVLANVLTNDGALVTTKKLLVSDPGPYNFQYYFSADSFAAPNLNACFSGFPDKAFTYDVKIELFDEYNNPIDINSGSPDQYLIDTNVNAISSGDTNWSFSANLSVGSYTLVKTLMPNTSQAEVYKQAFEDHLWSNINSGNCDSLFPAVDGCADCISICDRVVLNDPGNGYYIDGDSTNTYYSTEQEAKDKCLELCENKNNASAPIPDYCTSYRKILLADMSPGGQYFDNSHSLYTTDSLGDEVLVSNYKDLMDDWLDAELRDSSGVRLGISDFHWTDANGDTIDLVQAGWTSWDDIRENWRDEWAELLLPYHPEYCMYEFQCRRLVCGDPRLQYGDMMRFRRTMYQKEIWNPLNLPKNLSPGREYQPYDQHSISGSNCDGFDTIQDPLFSNDYANHPVSSISAIATEIEDYLQKYLSLGGSGYHSIWYFIDDPDNIAGGSGSVPAHIRDIYQTFHGGGGKIGLFNTSLDKYEFFKSVYFFFRDYIIYKEIDSVCGHLAYKQTLTYLTEKDYGVDFTIRFPRNDTYDNFDPQDPRSLVTFAQGLAAQQGSEPKADDGITEMDITCVCDKITDFLVKNGTIASADDFGITSSSIIVSAVATNLGLTVTTADVDEWKSYCTDTTSTSTIQDLVYTYALPTAFLCNTVLDASCSCNKLRDMAINAGFITSTQTLNDINVAHELATIRNYFDDQTLTQNQVQAWIDSCRGGEQVLEQLIADHGLPLSLLCQVEADASCSCDTLRGYLVYKNILNSTAPLGAAEAGDIASLFKISTMDAKDWLDYCAGESSKPITTLVQFHEYPSFLVCADPPEVENAFCAALREQDSIINLIRQEQFVDSLVNIYYQQYLASNMNSVSETFTLRYTPKDYAYTLFYFDQSGNLLKTVPPQGVSFLTSTIDLNMVKSYRAGNSGSTPVYNNHTYVSKYTYNSLNQLISQETPDGGLTYFWYDVLQRQVLSQDAQQIIEDKYGYTLYDELGRVSESGQLVGTAGTLNYDYLDSIVKADSYFQNFVTAKVREEVVFTKYDSRISTGVNGAFTGGQTNLRNRVAGTLWIDQIAATVTPYAYLAMGSSLSSAYLAYQRGTHYSYDLMGNVKELIQENKAFYGNSKISIQYEYDLVSGNVKEVKYQPGKWDQFYHRYYYDADNRLTEVQTSKDYQVWEQDARYHYYPEGPMARTEIGDEHVQGMDYAYTINGWLKGVNSTVKTAQKDMGQDGLTTGANNINRNFSEDAYAFSLGYFDESSIKDYTAISGNTIIPSINNTSYQNYSPSLYNGNISRMITALWDLNEDDQKVNGMAYKYDNMNRIKESRSFEKNAAQLISSQNFSGIALSNKFRTTYKYWLDGDLDSLQRWDDGGSSMDELDYQYYSGKHRLEYVDDNAVTALTTDLEAQSAGNYTYDATGNLIRDNAEGISQISWYANGKVKEVRFTDYQDNDIAFYYDASGNRSAKVLKTKNTNGTYKDPDLWEYYHYVRNANGQTMAVYKEDLTVTGTGCMRSTLTVQDQPVYGSSRLGSYMEARSRDYNFSASVNSANKTIELSQTQSNCGDNLAFSPTTFSMVTGDKYYELTNHLGNVLSTVSDRKIWKNIGNTVTEVFDNTFDDPDPSGWSSYPENGSATLDFREGSMIIRTEERNAGISKIVEDVDPDCTYELCITLAEGDFSGELWVVIQSGDGRPVGEIQKITKIGEEFCFTLSELEGGSYGIGLILPDGGMVSIDRIRLSKTCPAYKLVADVRAYQQYYPFGMMKPSRFANSGNYRYRFNGMESDDEIMGSSNFYTTEYRMLDPRIGRWISMDPALQKYPSWSPYTFAFDNPVMYNDAFGDDPCPGTEPECEDFKNKGGGNPFKAIGRAISSSFEWLNKQITGKGKELEVDYQHVEQDEVVTQVTERDGGRASELIRLDPTDPEEKISINYNTFTYPDQIDLDTREGSVFSTNEPVSTDNTTVSQEVNTNGATNVRVRVRPQPSSTQRSYYDVNVTVTNQDVVYRRTRRKVFFGLFTRSKYRRFTGSDAQRILNNENIQDRITQGTDYQREWRRKRN